MELEKLHKINCFWELPNPLYYCKETGGLYRQMKTGLREIKSVDGQGYSQVRVNGKNVKIHTIVAMEFLGHVPDKTNKVVVDHINGNKLDNRIENLQLISHRANVAKGKLYTNKASGLPLNIRWRKQKQKYEVRFMFNKQISFGLYRTLEAATIARNEIQTRLIENGEYLEYFKSEFVTAKRFKARSKL